MNCKNCNHTLQDEGKFCPNCGGKVIQNRLSIKTIWHNFANEVLGWDNRYFITLKMLLLHPDILLKEYLGGVRKKYVAPFTFLAIGTALAMLVFNQFADEYVSISETMGKAPVQLMGNYLDDDLKNSTSYQESLDHQLEVTRETQYMLLKYFNILSFALIPIYGLIALLVFWKPYNFGEHLIITCYIQGFLFLVGVILFTTSILTKSTLAYALYSAFTSIYYLYAYGKLYKFKFKHYIIAIFKFIGVVVGISLVLGIIMGIVGIIIGIKSQI